MAQMPRQPSRTAKRWESDAVPSLAMRTADSGLQAYDRLGPVLAFAEQPDGTGRAVIFQIDASRDDQDMALGMDTYCVVTEDAATYYGGVIALELASVAIARTNDWSIFSSSTDRSFKDANDE